MPWTAPSYLLVREIFKANEKLARCSLWAAMLAESTAPPRKEGGRCPVFQGIAVCEETVGERWTKGPRRDQSPTSGTFS